jgi:hypothetical protein
MTPRLDWGISRSCYGGNPADPSGYTAYLILWDGNRHSADWFGKKGEEVVGIFVCRHLHPGYADAFVVHEVNLRHHEVSAHPEPLTDGEVIRLACQRLNSPINFGKTVSEWRSVQEHVHIDMGICVLYNALFLRGDGDRYLITLAHMCRGDHEAFLAAEKITPADCRENDECVTVGVPQCGFRAEYCRALRQVYQFDPRWRTAEVLGIARGIIEGWDPQLMPVLADALEDAGCPDQAILAHCRGPGHHARRCWVLDVIFGTAEPGAATGR